MKKYKVILPEGDPVVVEAEYFTMNYDEFGGYNAYFKTTQAHVEYPGVTRETLVAFVKHPVVVMEVQALDRTPQEG